MNEPKECEVCKKVVTEWWYVVCHHRPSGAARYSYQCGDCGKLILDYINLLKGEVKNG